MTDRLDKPSRAFVDDDPVVTADIKSLSDACKGEVQPIQVLLDEISGDGVFVDNDDDAPPLKSVADALAWMVLEASLPRDVRLRIRKGRPLAVVVQTPGPDWCTPIYGAIVRDPKKIRCIVRDGSSKSHKPTEGNDEIGGYLAKGETVFGVSQAPSSFLPSTLVAAADARVTVASPDARLLRALLRRYARGSIPPISDGIAKGLAFWEIVSAFRAGATAREVIGNLARIAASRTATSVDDDTPRFEDLPYDGDALAFGRAVVADVARWRTDPVAAPWSDLTSRALLVGKPGVGKTLIARALARSIEAPLFALSCGELFARTDGHLHAVLQYLGAEIDRARAVARSGRPAVVLLDEFEALCPSRAQMDSRNKDYFTVVVTRVLTLLDGAGSVVGGADDLTGVVVLAATNHANHVDEAAFRRLHRVIEIRPPDAEGLARVLRFHLGDRLPDADLASVAAMQQGATPANAAQWVRDATGLAREAGRVLSFDDLIAVVAPPDDRSAELLRLIAVHEAGHAVAYAHFGHRLDSLSLIQRGDIGGRTTPRRERVSAQRRKDIDSEATALLAGRAAEEAILGEVSGGAIADLSEATRRLAGAHAAQGLGKTLLHRDPTQALLHDRRLREIVEGDLQRHYARALALIRDRRADVERLAHALIARRFLTGDDVHALLSAPPPDDPNPKGAT